MPIGISDGQKLCNQYGFYEVGNHFFVAWGVHKVADPVVGAGKGVASDIVGRGIEDIFAHGAGYVVIRLAMDDQNGYAGVADGITGCGCGNIKTAEEQSSQTDEGECEIRWEAHLFADFLDDALWRMIGAVGYNALDIGGQMESGRHQNGGCAHGEAIEENVAVKTHRGIVHPLQAVQTLQDPKGDGIALTFSVSPLIHEKQILFQFKTKFGAAGEVRHGAASVSVETNDQRGAVPDVVIAAVKGETIVGDDGNILKGPLRQLDEDPAHGIPVGFKLGPL